MIILFFLIYLDMVRKKVIEGLNTFAGRLSIDSQYFYDQIFDDVSYYPNDKDGTTGWIKCKQQCPGHCIEFGVSGNAYCFPY